MLGLKGFLIFCAYTGSIISTLLCVVYGIVNWNNPKHDEEESEITEEMEWEKSEPDLN